MNSNIKLDVDHHNASRVEHFLNSIDGKLDQIPFNTQALQHAEDIIAAFKFKVGNQSTFITVIFATSYFRANEIGTVNSFHKMPNTKWTVNGDLLFVVESTDVHALNKLLSHFAGRE